jgi:hypothetical protein
MQCVETGESSAYDNHIHRRASLLHGLAQGTHKAFKGLKQGHAKGLAFDWPTLMRGDFLTNRKR